MPTRNDEMNPIAKTIVMIGAVALIPTLFLVSHVMDDSAETARLRAGRQADQEAKYRRIMYDEIDRRLGNRMKP